jgi:hypothetical protein
MSNLRFSPLCPSRFPLFSVLVGILVMGLLQAASAQTCLKDAYGKNVQCTANDVRIAYATNPRSLTGTPITSCNAGTTFNFVADFHVTTTATARENIGMYFATGGQGNALTGTCADNIIAPLHTSSTAGATVQLGSAQYQELDASPDNCGDISTANNNQIVTAEVDNVLCQAAAGTDQLTLPNCTSWQQPGGTLSCVSPPPSYPWVPAAIPGSPSKCNCDNTFTVPIRVQSPSATVAKSCNTALTTGDNHTSCDAGPEGSSVTYHVAITNTSNFGSLFIDQICDSAYGNVFTASGYTPACTAGTIGTVTGSNTCASGLTIAAASTGTCSFTVTQGENATVKNTLTAKGHGSGGTSFGPTQSNEVTVISSDAPSTATITKGFGSNQEVCATLRYNVDVKNTSGADEHLTLSALTDSAFGNIAPTPGANILATTCGVSSSSGGAGTLPTTLAVGGNDYQCTFDAQFCAAPKAIVSIAGKCTNNTCTAGKAGDACSSNSDCDVACNGIQHTNTVSATMTGDEKEAVTQTVGTLTASECITVVTQ